MRIALVAVSLMIGCSRPEPAPRPDEPKPAPSAKQEAKKVKPPKEIKDEDDELPKDEHGPPKPTAKKPFAVKTFDATTVPKELTLDGRIETGAAWTDAFGDNLAIFTRRESKASGASSVYLRAYHFARASTAWKLVREVKDQNEKCDYDNVTAFANDSVRVTDEDKNGIGELGFAYLVDCTSDVSPNTAKLLLLEGGSKSIFRGSTRVNDGVSLVGGEFKPDPAKAAWKPSLLARA